MKKLLFFLLLVPGTSVAQTSISNPDGTYSLFYYSPYGSTIIYSDGSHALVADHDSASATIVYPDFSYSRIFYNGPVTTVIHSDFSYSITIDDAPNPETDSSSTYDEAPVGVNSTADTGYILLSEDSTAALKPDPGEAHYILLNNLVDTTTMRSNRSLPGTPEPTGKDQNGSPEAIHYLRPANLETRQPGKER